jgi:hypothetical protein
MSADIPPWVVPEARAFVRGILHTQCAPTKRHIVIRGKSGPSVKAHVDFICSALNTEPLDTLPQARTLHKRVYPVSLSVARKGVSQPVCSWAVDSSEGRICVFADGAYWRNSISYVRRQIHASVRHRITVVMVHAASGGILECDGAATTLVLDTPDVFADRREELAARRWLCTLTSNPGTRLNALWLQLLEAAGTEAAAAGKRAAPAPDVQQQQQQQQQKPVQTTASPKNLVQRTLAFVV